MTLHMSKLLGTLARTIDMAPFDGDGVSRGFPVEGTCIAICIGKHVGKLCIGVTATGADETEL